MGAGRHDDKSIGRPEGQRQFMGEIIRMFRSIILGKKETVGIRTETTAISGEIHILSSTKEKRPVNSSRML